MRGSDCHGGLGRAPTMRVRLKKELVRSLPRRFVEGRPADSTWLDCQGVNVTYCSVAAVVRVGAGDHGAPGTRAPPEPRGHLGLVGFVV
jgi:hypothetical protein